MKSLMRFIGKILNIFRMRNQKIQQQLSGKDRIVETGKGLLRQLVDEFSKLKTTSNAWCQLVDNDERVIFRLLDIWAVIKVEAASDKLGILVLYAAETWSSKWEDYTILVDMSFKFDNLGNLIHGERQFPNPEEYGMDILEYILQKGKSPDKI